MNREACSKERAVPANFCPAHGEIVAGSVSEGRVEAKVVITKLVLPGRANFRPREDTGHAPVVTGLEADGGAQ